MLARDAQVTKLQKQIERMQKEKTHVESHMKNEQSVVARLGQQADYMKMTNQWLVSTKWQTRNGGGDQCQ